MSLVVVGVNHRTAPVSLLERLAIGEESLTKALHHLATYEHIAEGAILSTCNRIEVYASVTRFHGGAQDLRNFLSEFCHVAPEDFADHAYTYHDDGAAGHLFRVAAGIDSMVVGESEILGQVRRALSAAEQEGTASRTLRKAFTHALRVGKRARSETQIARNPISISSAAVDLARRAYPEGSLAGKRVAIVGAGKMGRLAVRALAGAGADDVTVVNRSEERAASVAADFGVRPQALEALPGVLADADIVICSTTAPGAVLDRATVETAMSGRADRLMFIVDIAVPRDVEPDVATVRGVVLRDIDDLRAVAAANVGGRVAEISDVERIVAAEIERFLRWERGVEVAPVIAQLVERSESMRRVEVERHRTQLAALSPEQRDAVEQLTRRIVNKMLHSPLKVTRELAASSQGHLHLEVLHELFELDDDIS